MELDEEKLEGIQGGYPIDQMSKEELEELKRKAVESIKDPDELSEIDLESVKAGMPYEEAKEEFMNGRSM